MGRVPRVATSLGLLDILCRWLAWLGLWRDSLRVSPGLYATGWPDGDSPIMLCANHRPDFDALRSTLGALNSWLLVLDTRGAEPPDASALADQLAARVDANGLERVVEHRQLTLPKGTSLVLDAQQVCTRSGFWFVQGGPWGGSAR